MKNHYQTVKDIPKTPQKKLRKHSIRLKHARGSNSKKRGAHSIKNQENLKKPKDHGYQVQTHGSDGSGSS